MITRRTPTDFYFGRFMQNGLAMNSTSKSETLRLIATLVEQQDEAIRHHPTETVAVYANSQQMTVDLCPYLKVHSTNGDSGNVL